MSAASGRSMSGLYLVPIDFSDAKSFITGHHRHHRPPTGHKFSVGVALDGVLVGVACVGRPIPRSYQDGLTLEVNRTATDGCRNANSKLYAAAWQGAKARGYQRLITYTQDGESGASLRAAGYRVVAERKARKGWNSVSRPREDKGNDGVARTLWEAS